MRYLFVGGIKDGETCEVDTDEKYFTVHSLNREYAGTSKYLLRPREGLALRVKDFDGTKYEWTKHSNKIALVYGHEGDYYDYAMESAMTAVIERGAIPMTLYVDTDTTDSLMEIKITGYGERIVP